MPRGTILDKGAAKVILSKSFAAAIIFLSADVDLGIDFFTAGGAVGVPMGVTRKKVGFILSRGTPRGHRVSLCITVVDTTAYDALLGMECDAAMEGCYITYTEIFRYGRVGLDGLTQSNDLSAPSHLSSPPLIVCAFFGGLIGIEAEIIDVQGADDDNVPETALAITQPLISWLRFNNCT